MKALGKTKLGPTNQLCILQVTLRNELLDALQSEQGLRFIETKAHRSLLLWVDTILPSPHTLNPHNNLMILAVASLPAINCLIQKLPNSSLQMANSHARTMSLEPCKIRTTAHVPCSLCSELFLSHAFTTPKLMIECFWL